MINYSTLINVMRLLSKSVDPVLKNVEETMKKMKEETKPKEKSEERKPIQLSKHDLKELKKEKNSLYFRQKVRYLF